MEKNELTPEQLEILERNRPYYEGLLLSDKLGKISSVTVDQFCKIYTHVTGLKASKNCSACVVEIVEIIYRIYDERKERNTAGAESAQAIGTEPGQTGTKPGLPPSIDETKNIRKRRKPAGTS